VEPLVASDVVAVAQCIAIDADVFPYASAHFGLRSAASPTWVARDLGDPRVLGFLAAHVGRGVLHMDGVAVDRAARRRGIGRALVREAVACAQDRRLRVVTLHVSVVNRAAIALYESEGFVVERRMGGFYPAAAFGGEADAFEMTLELMQSGLPR